MALPFVFATSPAGNTPASEIDSDLNAVGQMAVTFCTATGTNAYALTPVANQPPITAMNNGQMFSFICPNGSTGAVTLNINGLGAFQLVVNTIQVGAGALVATLPYFVFFDSATSVFRLFGFGRFQQPSIQSFTSGSGTYTTPIGAVRLYVRMVGGGGGGGGSGTGAGGGNGGGATASLFGSSFLTAGGGAGGVGGGGNGGSGGAASGGDVNVSGQTGGAANGSGSGVAEVGGAGGNAGMFFIGGGASSAAGGNVGQSATAPGGAGSGASQSTTISGGTGGGGGGALEKTIVNPNATYTFQVGAAGAAGTAGTNGGAGGVGFNGRIDVYEFYI